MTYNFGNRLDTLGPRMKEINNEPITITDGVTTVTIEQATPALFETYEEMAGVPMTQITYQDWIVDSAELEGFNPPQPGLLITRVNTGEKFRTTSPYHDDAPFKYTTPSKLRIRIHSCQIANS